MNALDWLRDKTRQRRRTLATGGPVHPGDTSVLEPGPPPYTIPALPVVLGTATAPPVRIELRMATTAEITANLEQFRAAIRTGTTAINEATPAMTALAETVRAAEPLPDLAAMAALDKRHVDPATDARLMQPDDDTCPACSIRLSRCYCN